MARRGRAAAAPAAAEPATQDDIDSEAQEAYDAEMRNPSGHPDKKEVERAAEAAAESVRVKHRQ